jgi:hypothetical protein
MTLEDRIARLINPDIPWDEPGDKTGYRWLDWELWGRNRDYALAAARRVIDGLHLDINSSRHSLDGHRHRYDLTGHIREDL